MLWMVYRQLYWLSEQTVSETIYRKLAGINLSRAENVRLVAARDTFRAAATGTAD